MIVDSSALCAIAFRETGFEAFETALAHARGSSIGAPTAAEAAIVIAARLGGSGGEAVLGALLGRFEIVVVPFAAHHWRLAASAYVRYGRGRHKAALNYGDCLSYALATETGLPLLFKGDDFARTDVPRAL